MVMIKSSKEKTDLIKKVSSLDASLSNKEKNLFQKVLEKGFKNWNDCDIEFLTLLYDLHHYSMLRAFGVEICPHEQTEQIEREEKLNRDNARKRLAEEPYSLWFKDIRHYK
jgi:hypothetical protein